MKLDRDHFRKLVECYEGIKATPNLPTSVWVGRSTADWLASVMNDQCAETIGRNLTRFDNRPYNRIELREKISKSELRHTEENLRDLVLDIFAWGRMSAKNARYAIPSWKCWKQPCFDLVNGLEASAAYESFHQLQMKRAMKGVGPAYYTKLIYFLGTGDGLIMDQWTGRSMNLLFGNFIKINRERKNSDRATVDMRNAAEVYLNYNAHVEVVSKALSKAINSEISPSQAEELMFSISSMKRPQNLNDEQYRAVSAWRRHVTLMDREQKPS